MFTSICMINVQVGIPELNPTDTTHWSGHKMFSSTILYVELKPLILAVRFVAEDCSPNGAHPSHPRCRQIQNATAEEGIGIAFKL